jgi:hypothetical protein
MKDTLATPRSLAVFAASMLWMGHHAWAQISAFAQTCVPAEHFGTSCANVGDINHDGTDDIALGGPGGNGTLRGTVVVVSGATGTLLFTTIGDAVGDGYGVSVSGIGDVDHDGYADVLVGAFNHQKYQAEGRNGYARIVSGKDGTTIRTLTTASNGSQFGLRVLGLADVDGDGVPDFAVSSPAVAALGGARPIVEVFSGATGGLLYKCSADACNDGFGYSLANTTDIDGDGTNDFLVGAPNEARGYVKLCSGRDGHTLRKIYGPDVGTKFGTCIASGGDLNGDGKTDIAVVDPDGNPAAGTSTIRVYTAESGDLITDMHGQPDSIYESVALIPRSGSAVFDLLAGDVGRGHVVRFALGASGLGAVQDVTTQDAAGSCFGSSVCTIKGSGWSGSCYVACAMWGTNGSGTPHRGRAWIVDASTGALITELSIPPSQ